MRKKATSHAMPPMIEEKLEAMKAKKAKKSPAKHKKATKKKKA